MNHDQFQDYTKLLLDQLVKELDSEGEECNEAAHDRWLRTDRQRGEFFGKARAYEDSVKRIRTLRHKLFP